MNTKLNLKKNTGFSLIEMIFYISLFALFSIAVVNTLITMTRSFKETAMYTDLIQVANVVEKMSRTIRYASGVSAISANDITLNTDGDIDSDVSLVRFALSNGDINIYEDGVLVDNLNSSDITVSDLSFTQITTTQGIAVKIYLAVSSNKDSTGRIFDFYNTVVLRGSY